MANTPKISIPVKSPRFSQPGTKHQRSSATLFWIILGLGVLLRIVGFPNTPVGLNADELSAGYESWSLFSNGTDRWGYQLPIYFLSWGPGQNVLYSYLSIPFLSLFGLNAFDVRFVALIFGILLIPLMYATVRLWFNKRVALFAMLIAAVFPYFVMSSRWALESDLLPFFLLLGLYCLSKALKSEKRRWIILSLLPFAFSFYAYGMSFFITVPFLFLMIIVYRKEIWKHIKQYAIATGIFFVVSLPFFFFLLRNYTKVNTSWMDHLFFTVPKLPSSQITKVLPDYAGNFLSNFAVFLSGLNDNNPWNSLRAVSPLPMWGLAILLIGFVLLILELRGKNIKLKNVLKNPVILLTLSCITPMFFILLDTNRWNAFFIPAAILIALTLDRALSAVPKKKTANIVAIILGVAMLIALIPGGIEYFGGQNSKDLAPTFTPTLKTALTKIDQDAAGAPIYITDKLSINYVRVLWYEKIPPATYIASKPKPAWNHPDFDNYLFSPTDVRSKHLVTYWTLQYPVAQRFPATLPTCEPGYKVVSSDSSVTGWQIAKCSLKSAQ